MTETREIYFSIDVETDGPIPGPNSMLSIGAAAFLPNKTLLDTFSKNLTCIEGAVGDPDTMSWWKTQPDAWAACRKDTQAATRAMKKFKDWVEQVCANEHAVTGVAHKAVFVGYPAGFDFLFVYWYLIRFTGSSPFSFSAVDTKTLAWAALGCHNYRDIGKRTMPKRWMSNHPHTHVAVDDAIEQGELFCNILADIKNGANK